MEDYIVVTTYILCVVAALYLFQVLKRRFRAADPEIAEADLRASQFIHGLASLIQLVLLVGTVVLFMLGIVEL